MARGEDSEDFESSVDGGRSTSADVDRAHDGDVWRLEGAQVV